MERSASARGRARMPPCGSGCITALQVTSPATLADRELAPAFSLPAQDGAPVSLAGAIAGGPVALVFYRGYW